MTCRACGGACEPWTTAPGSEPADTGAYPLELCTTCGTAVTAGPGPTPAAYAAGIYAERPLRLGGAVGLVQRAATRLPLRLLRRAGVRPGDRVLDAGAGRGRLVAALASHGYAAEGIDPSPRGEAVAHGSIGAHSASSLDAVVLWHVLEHLDDPPAALARVASWLGPRGVVVVAVPNVGSLQARIAGPAWFHLDVPRHRTHFTVDGLRRALRGAGLEPRGVRHLVPEHNFHGMWFALLTRIGMTPGFPFHAVKRNVRATPRDVALVALAGPLLLLPAIALELVAVALRRGGTVAVAARAQSRA